MKQNNWFKKEQELFSSKLSANKNISIKCKEIALAPFLLKIAPQYKKIFVVTKKQLDQIGGFFDQEDEKTVVVGRPPKHRDSAGFIDYDKQAYNININKCGLGWEGIKTVVVDESSLGLPLPSFKKEEKIVIKEGAGLERDWVIKKLKSFGYKQKTKKEEGSSFIVRGGVLDVFMKQKEGFVRVSFLEEGGLKVYRVTQKGLFSIKEIKEVSIRGASAEKGKTIKESIGKDDLVVFYSDENLVFTKKGNEEEIKIKVFSETLTYEKYKKNTETDCFYSKSLNSQGVVLSSKKIVVPFWFKKTKKEAFSSLHINEMREGDLFVHDSFGFCRFDGVENSVNNNEKICLSFEDGKLKIDVSKIKDLHYYGSKNEGKKLSFLSKKGVWKRTKQKHLDIASDFVSSLFFSYEKRKKTKRKPCVIDVELDSLFSSGFKHKETKDQLLSIKDIYKDLTSSGPMTRLLCGDVGFGKTEVALRSAFLCHYNEKPVVLVAPTRILSQQLADVFSSRFSLLSIKTTKSINRFINHKDEILITTHRVFNNEKALALCGFMIVDEEHRFGVNQKEKIKKSNPFCDILYMSATPLPRTLQLTLSKQRNISQIKTPPLSKKQILTRIYYYNKNLIKEIIVNEINRGGQVFFVENSVYNVKKTLSLIFSLFPGLTVKSLYSSLDEKQITQTMREFRQNKISVLVSTSIIESGIDVGNANTIIINNCDRFGLSQLYQLRGRVGRGFVQAHAFLLVSKKYAPTSLPRLQSLIKNQSLGSGYSIAFDDLKIRGSGSPFGYKQSGASGVGFEYYSSLLALAASKITGQEKTNKGPFVLGSPGVPSHVVPSPSERIQIYKKVSDCSSVLELENYRSRFKGFSSFFPFYCLFSNKKLEILIKQTCFFSFIYNKGVLFVVFSLSSSFYSFSYVDSFFSFLNKNKISFKSKKDALFVKIQFKKSIEDCYILLLKFLGKKHV